MSSSPRNTLSGMSAAREPSEPRRANSRTSLVRHSVSRRATGPASPRTFTSRRTASSTADCPVRTAATRSVRSSSLLPDRTGTVRVRSSVYVTAGGAGVPTSRMGPRRGRPAPTTTASSFHVVRPPPAFPASVRGSTVAVNPARSYRCRERPDRAVASSPPAGRSRNGISRFPDRSHPRRGGPPGALRT
ncbi:hypothetical protein SBADM41S_01817 [Streptomyces badius]